MSTDDRPEGDEHLKHRVAEEPGRVRVDWAVQSKRPGAGKGYALLAGSIDSTRALRLIEAGTTGTPAGEDAGRVDALPWVSFVADRTGSSATLGVVERSWTDEHDVTGQPIVPARLLAVGWPTSKPTLLGFVGLLALARSVRWAGVDGPPEGVRKAAPIDASVPPLNVDLLVRAIEDVGFDWALTAAVALLDGHQVVVVTPGRILSLQQRAQLLDAVCALLPYGCRAWISASTWARDRSAHPVRLSFAERGRPGQRVIHFDEFRPEPPRTPEASAYLTEMTHLRSEGFPVAQIVAHLAELYEPLEPREAGLAVRHLRELRLVASTVEDIQRGRADPSRVNDVLTRFGWGDLDDPTQAALVSFLADAAVGESGSGRVAREVLQRHWAAEPLHHLVGEIVADLADGNAERPRRRMAILADLAPTVRDELVAVVLHHMAQKAEAQTADRTIALLVDTHSPAPRNAAAWEVLARCPELGARLLRAMSDLRQDGADARFGQALDALAAHDGGPDTRWVNAVRALFADGRLAPDTGALPGPVLAVLLEVALARNAVRQLLGVAWEHVLRAAYEPGGGGHPRLEAIATQVAAAPEVPLGPEAAAAATLLALGADGRARLEVTGPEDLPPLATAWRALPEEARATLRERLPAAVLGRSMTPQSFRALVAVVEALEPAEAHGLRDRAAGEVSECLVRSPDLLPQLALDETLSADLVRYAPRYVWLKEWFAVRRTASISETGADVVRAAYTRLRSSGAPASAAMRAIAPWLAARGPEGLDELLRSGDGPTGESAGHGEEIRDGAFVEPELRGLGAAYHRLVQARHREHLAQAQYYQQQDRVLRAFLQRHDAPPSRSDAAQPDPAVPPRTGSTGAWQRVWARLRDPDA